tara:strand:- start:13449 stop:14672 length:1224 start_codon:yes stop_codon:yes gene_type:complete
MTLKNFFKTNYTISFLIILSFIIIVNNFFRFFQNQTTHQYLPWLSNYQGGFVRRGLPGELFFQLHEILNIHLGWIVFISVCCLYFLFYLTFFNLVKKIEINKIYIFALFSPIGFFFPVLNSKGTGHKEIILLCFISIFCYLIPRIKRNTANYVMLLLAIFVVLSHEGLIFFLPYLIIPYFIFYKFKDFKDLFINFLPITITTFLLAILVYLFHGSEQHVLDICNSIKSYTSSLCETSGQISALKFAMNENISQKSKLVYGGLSVYPSYFIIYGVGLIAGFLPLSILYGKSKILVNILNQKINPIFFLIFPLVLSFPIYYIAADWGRYLYISYMCSLVIIIFCVKNNILYIKQTNSTLKDNFLTKALFLFFIMFYGFGWSVPVCCEKQFKSGIFQSFNKAIYYYKENN